MTDSSSVTLTNEQLTLKKTPPAPGSSTPSASKKEEQKWYRKFASEPERPGHERWRDASLSDKQRWKEWQKAKDREQKAGGVTGYLGGYYKKSKAWCLGLGYPWV